MSKHEHLSLIRVYGSGKTQPGWGNKNFLTNLNKGAFDPTRALRLYEKYHQPFAFVMRSVPYVCVDVDGKNGGIETSNALRLTRTAAELSKSQSGYHIVYELPLSVWDPLYGYNQFPDFNGLIPGVDIRGVGAMFHFHNQRWNNLEPAPIPESLAKLIGKATEIRRLTRARKVKDMDPEDLAIMHDEMKMKLLKPIPKGQRNATLYKLGARMCMANYPAWDVELMKRGEQLGLDEQELVEIIQHIERYA